MKDFDSHDAILDTLDREDARREMMDRFADDHDYLHRQTGEERMTTTEEITELPWDTQQGITTLAASLRESTGKLSTLRIALAEKETAIKAKRAAFDESVRDEAQAIEAVKRAIEIEDGTVRSLAKVVHDQTGDKAPSPGVAIVIKKRYVIDEVAGLDWATKHGMLLIPAQLDLKGAAKMASVTPLPFVTVSEEAEVRIASDLAKALNDAT